MGAVDVVRRSVLQQALRDAPVGPTGAPVVGLPAALARAAQTSVAARQVARQEPPGGLRRPAEPRVLRREQRGAVRREWLVRPDERVRPACSDGQRRWVRPASPEGPAVAPAD